MCAPVQKVSPFHSIINFHRLVQINKFIGIEKDSAKCREAVLFYEVLDEFFFLFLWLTHEGELESAFNLSLNIVPGFGF